MTVSELATYCNDELNNGCTQVKITTKYGTSDYLSLTDLYTAANGYPNGNLETHILETNCDAH